jgi:hypothetical protein
VCAKIVFALAQIAIKIISALAQLGVKFVPRMFNLFWTMVLKLVGISHYAEHARKLVTG